MRGHDERSDFLFSYVAPEHRVPTDHPLRTVRQLTDAALERLSPRFAKMYSDIGRPSMPPEQLLRALVLQRRRTTWCGCAPWSRGARSPTRESGWSATNRTDDEPTRTRERALTSH